MKDITRIKAPKYKVGRHSLNEYELRILMLEVAKKEKPFGQSVKDQDGCVAIIKENGSLSCNLFGMDINSNTTIQLIKTRNKLIM